MKRIFIVSLVVVYTLNAFGQHGCDKKNRPTACVLLLNLQQYPINAAKPKLYLEGCNVNDSIKKMLSYRLRNWQWSDSAISAYILAKMKESEKFDKIDYKARLNASNDSIYLLNKMRIENSLQQEVLEEMGRAGYFTVDPNVILTVAWLNMKDCRRFLQDTAMKDSVHYPNWAVKLALAKMGDKKLEKFYIDAQKKINLLKPETFPTNGFFGSLREMGFLKTQESIFQLYRWIDTSFVWEPSSSGKTLAYLSAEYLYILKEIILNKEFQEIVRKVSPDDLSSKNEILSARTWLIRNRGKYILDPNFCSL